MTPDLWLHLERGWPGAAAGVTQRGPHDPAIPWSGYNMGRTAQADPATVDALRCRALAELSSPLLGPRASCPQPSAVGPPASSRQPSLVFAQQVHGPGVAVAHHADLPSLPNSHGYPYYPGCDALITAEPALALTLFYADCCPLILYCPEPLCGGVAHAGWRGTVAGMAASIVGALHRDFGAPPERMQALVGPCIGAECYPVGPEVLAAVEALKLGDVGAALELGDVGETLELGDVGAVTDRDGGAVHLDLLALNVALLERSGVPPAHIRRLTDCTRCGPAPLFSWRRDGPTCGRHVAMFTLTG